MYLGHGLGPGGGICLVQGYGRYPRGENVSLVCVPIGILITYGDTVIVPWGKGMLFEYVRTRKPLVTTFSEPFIGFRASGSETAFRAPRFIGFRSGQ